MTPSAPSPLQPALIGADGLLLALGFRNGTLLPPELALPGSPLYEKKNFSHLPLLPSPDGVIGTKLARCWGDQNIQTQSSPLYQQVTWSPGLGSNGLAILSEHKKVVSRHRKIGFGGGHLLPSA